MGSSPLGASLTPGGHISSLGAKLITGPKIKAEPCQMFYGFRISVGILLIFFLLFFLGILLFYLCRYLALEAIKIFFAIPR
jgi:hypothetical protein